jgi:hypothetical protein
MPQHTHSHGDAPPHEHADAAPGHTHDTDVVETRPAAVDVRPTAGGLTARIILTVLGAAGMIIGAFLPWLAFEAEEIPPTVGLGGIDLKNSIFYSVDDPSGATFIGSAGFVAIVLGVLALLGLAFRTGWLTTLAGVLGIVGFAAVLITLYRVPEASLGVGNVGIGLWIVLAGSVIAVIAGFFGARPRAVTSTSARF